MFEVNDLVVFTQTGKDHIITTPIIDSAMEYMDNLLIISEIYTFGSLIVKDFKTGYLLGVFQPAMIRKATFNDIKRYRKNGQP